MDDITTGNCNTSLESKVFENIARNKVFERYANPNNFTNEIDSIKREVSKKTSLLVISFSIYFIGKVSGACSTPYSQALFQISKFRNNTARTDVTRTMEKYC